MSNVLCFTIRFLDPEPSFHGKRDGGEPEWPPSPLRLFQSLVDAAASRWRAGMYNDYPKPALEWLQKFNAPTIIAPDFHVGIPYRIAVPNNDLDVWAGPISKGNVPKKQPNELKTMKSVRPTHLAGEAVHYLYPVADGDPELAKHFGTLQAAARSITHLGWGVDMVAADAKLITDSEADKLPGERWRPTDVLGGVGLRVPRKGTLADLSKKHEAFLNRLCADGFKPVPPLTAFRVVGYRRATDPAPRLRWAAYRIVSADPDAAKPPAFNTPRHTRDVAAWVRHAAGRVCAEWPDVATYIHGHDSTDDTKPAKGAEAEQRLWYLPLPTINSALNRVESIRRALIAAPIKDDRGRFDQVRRMLEGQELTWDGKAQGLLVPLAGSDWVLRQYTATASVWSTVTPVVWPGHDDRNADKAGHILRKAFVQAGLPKEVVDGIAEGDLEWRNVGFRPGVDLASQYQKPDKLTGRTSHVRVRFPCKVRGPLAVGAGRYRGLGVFAAEES